MTLFLCFCDDYELHLCTDNVGDTLTMTVTSLTSLTEDDAVVDDDDSFDVAL